MPIYLFLLIPLAMLLLTLLISEDMLLGFLMKKLASDSSAEGIRKITDTLESENIKYQIITIKGRGTIGSSLDARAYGRANISMYKYADRPGMIYVVYVRHKDYEKALSLIHTK